MKNDRIGEVKDVLKSIAILVLALALAVSVIFNLSCIEDGTFDKNVSSLDIAGVQHVLGNKEETISAEYPYTDYDEIEVQRQAFGWDMPFGSSSVTYTYSGVVKAGVKLSDVKPMSIDNENNIVTVKIADVECLANDIDYDSISIESAGYFQTVSKDSVEIDKNKMAEKAMTDENFITAVKEKTSSEINSIFAMNDKTKGYTVNIIWGDEQQSS